MNVRRQKLAQLIAFQTAASGPAARAEVLFPRYTHIRCGNRYRRARTQ
jgi:hypothetical protein